LQEAIITFSEDFFDVSFSKAPESLRAPAIKKIKDEEREKKEADLQRAKERFSEMRLNSSRRHDRAISEGFKTSDAMVEISKYKLREKALKDRMNKMKETYKVQIKVMNDIVSKYDLTHIQFTEFYDTMPPLNQTGFVKFDDWQVNVVDNVDNKISTVVSAPTSAGKSVVAGYTLTKGRGLIVVPTDPLAWQWASYVGGFLEKDIPIVTKT
jgi:superfamily II RNA helicase